MSNFTEDKVEKARDARIELGLAVVAGQIAAWFAPRDPTIDAVINGMAKLNAAEEEHGPAAVDAALAIARAARKP